MFVYRSGKSAGCPLEGRNVGSNRTDGIFVGLALFRMHFRFHARARRTCCSKGNQVYYKRRSSGIADLLRKRK